MCIYIFLPIKTGISNDSTVTIQCVNKKVTDISEKDAEELYNMLNDKELIQVLLVLLEMTSV
ncbi:MAG: hypothetical protein PUC69_06585 [Ruminococcus sp.]|nr:hypothetical protein [Ruminococcus sp.]MDD5890260.1 hypothetical protein [Ruminococcus sp.]